MPLLEIVCLEVDGNVEEIKARQTNLDIYPDPKICRPARSLQLTDEELLSDNLVSFCVILYVIDERKIHMHVI